MVVWNLQRIVDMNANTETRKFEVTFKPYGAGAKRLTWTRCYVPGVSDAECHVMAIQAMRNDYPKARLLTIAAV